MVRNIAGTLVEVGKGKQPVTWPAEVLASRDRRQAGMTAPAQGLFLVGVQYGDGQERGEQNEERGMAEDDDLGELE
jgi:tRNA pseudouridine38-40 synthase